MSVKTTESIGINNLIILLSKTGFIDATNIEENDKTASWDGFFLLHNDKTGKKNSILGKVSTQVKTIHSESRNYKFPISKEDLENYLTEGHIFYFYIKLDRDNNPTYYYLPLLLWDLKNCLKKFGDKKTKSFEFQIFPTDAEQILFVVRKFVDEMRRQKQLMPGVESVSDLILKKGKDIQLSFDLNFKGEPTIIDLVKEMKLRPYLRYRCDEVGLDFVVDRLPSNVLLEIKTNKTIGVGNKIFYHDISYVSNGDTVVIKGGSAVDVTIKNNNSLSIEYRIEGDLNERLTALRFINDMCLQNNITIGKNMIQLNPCTLSDIKNKSAPLFELYSCLAKILDYLEINKEPCFENATDEDVKMTYALYNALIKNQKIKSSYGKSRFIIAELCGLKIYLSEIVDKNGQSRIVPWDKFDMYFETANQEKIKASAYYIFSIQDINMFLSIDNYNLDKFIDELFSSPQEVIESGYIEYIVLNMVSAFDSTNNYKFLDTALSISEKTLKLYPNNVSALINKAQILIRMKKPIENKFKESLQHYLSELAPVHSICFGICAVLGNKKQAEKEFKDCSEEEKNKIIKWPIYHLYQQG